MCCLSCGSVWKVSVTDITKAKRQGLLQVTWKTMEAAVTRDRMDRNAKSVTTSPFLLFNEMVQRLPLSWVPQSPACWIGDSLVTLVFAFLCCYTIDTIYTIYKLKFTAFDRFRIRFPESVLNFSLLPEIHFLIGLAVQQPMDWRLLSQEQWDTLFRESAWPKTDSKAIALRVASSLQGAVAELIAKNRSFWTSKQRKWIWGNGLGKLNRQNR